MDLNDHMLNCKWKFDKSHYKFDQTDYKSDCTYPSYANSINEITNQNQHTVNWKWKYMSSVLLHYQSLKQRNGTANVNV
jgi:hypothetical protein